MQLCSPRSSLLSRCAFSSLPPTSILLVSDSRSLPLKSRHVHGARHCVRRGAPLARPLSCIMATSG